MAEPHQQQQTIEAPKTIEDAWPVLVKFMQHQHVHNAKETECVAKQTDHNVRVDKKLEVRIETTITLKFSSVRLVVDNMSIHKAIHEGTASILGIDVWPKWRTPLLLVQHIALKPTVLSSASKAVSVS